MKVLRALKLLYVQVLVATVLGVMFGLLFPETGVALKPLGDAFIRVIRMIIAPVVFCTVAIGIAHMSDLKKFGRVGGKTLHLFRSGLHARARHRAGGRQRRAARRGLQHRRGHARSQHRRAIHQGRHGNDTVQRSVLHIIPDTLFSPFITGDLLQVLFVAILTGFACSRLGSFGAQVAHAPGKRDQGPVLASFTSSSGRHRSARSAPWRSPSAAMASIRCGRSRS